MQMTKEEIWRMYRESKNPNRQIGILAELNACDRTKIENILFSEDEPEEMPKEEIKINRPKELTRGQIMDILFKEMDELDNMIKMLEEKHRKIGITIEMLSKIRP